MPTHNQTVHIVSTKTPYGILAVAHRDKYLVALKLGNDAVARVQWEAERQKYTLSSQPGPHSKELISEIKEYFSGKRKQFSFKPKFAGTAFQQKVYGELMRVPYGQTITYGELAERAGRPGAARAVGTTMATNRIAIVVPCHRVVGSQGCLGGYGYGLDMKKNLLKMEGCANPSVRL